MPDGYSIAMPPSAATPPFRSDSGQRKLVASAPSRIVILVENLPVPSDRRVWQQATTLARAGHSVTVICPKGKGWTRSREMIEGVTILRHRLPEARGRLGYPLEYAIALGSQTLLTWRVFLRSGIDVIQACNPPDLLFLIAAQFKPFEYGSFLTTTICRRNCSQ